MLALQRKCALLVALGSAACPPELKIYVYDTIDWLAMTCDGVRVEDALRNHTWPAVSKHSDDFWFLKHALAHPRQM